jgi:hypothetical protein
MNVAFFVNFLLGSLGAVLVMFLRIIESTRSAGKALQWVMRLFPAFSFGYGFINIGMIDNWSIEANLPPGEVLSVYDMNVAGGDILYLGIFGFIYFAIIFIVEYINGKGSILAKCSLENSIPYTPKL